jgi:flagellar FliJ protein
MPKFVFTLAAVLSQRSAVEKMKQARVAELERERAGIETALAEAQEGISRAKLDLRDLLSGGRAGTQAQEVSQSERNITSATDLRGAGMQARATMGLDLRARRQAITLAGVYARLARAKEELTRACVDRRAVELLRERQLEAWKREQAVKESAFMDEVATRAYITGSIDENLQ